MEELIAFLKSKGFTRQHTGMKVCDDSWWCPLEDVLYVCEKNKIKPSLVVWLYEKNMEGKVAVEAGVCGAAFGVWFKPEVYGLLSDGFIKKYDMIRHSLAAVWDEFYRQCDQCVAVE